MEFFGAYRGFSQRIPALYPWCTAARHRPADQLNHHDSGVALRYGTVRLLLELQLPSGTDANTEPLAANLSVPASSVGPGQLELVATNAEGAITNFVTLASPNIMVTQTNNNLILAWSSALIGSQLQAQTNSLATGLGTNWVNYNPSTATNQVVIPINPGNGTVFYRLLIP